MVKTNKMLENKKSAHATSFILKIYALRQKKHIKVCEQKYKNAYYFLENLLEYDYNDIFDGMQFHRVTLLYTY